MISAQDIHRILVEHIDRDRASVGVAVGTIDEEGARFVGHGAGTRDGVPVHGDTIFEIGSITKVFTALLLADMVQRGEVRLDDPVSAFLPTGVTVPSRNGRDITLQHLATHTSGLPRLPANLGLTLTSRANPYGNFTVDRLYEALTTCRLTREVGATFEYSNFGYGVLGHALERRASQAFEDLVRERIAGPLRLKDTSVVLTPEQRTRLADGHNAQLTAVPHWDLGALAAAGALKSTVNDLLLFLSAVLDRLHTTLAPAIAALLSSRRQIGATSAYTTLGWRTRQSGTRDIVWHNGGTGGFASFLGYDRRARTGVVVLANTFRASTTSLVGVDGIAYRLLDPLGLSGHVGERRAAIALETDVLERYVGRYELMAGTVISVLREGSQLFFDAPGEKRRKIHPEAEREFFAPIGGLQMTFELDDRGIARSVRLHRDGDSIGSARRV